MINIADLLLENNTASERPNNDNPIVNYSDNHEKIDNDTKVEDNEPLDESGFIVSDDIYCFNFNKLDSGKTNILLVTGLSGSGKSTYASLLSKIYEKRFKKKYIHFELDCLDFYLSGKIPIENIKKSEPGLYDFINKKKLAPEKRKYNNTETVKLYKEYIKYLISWCKKHKENCYIIEGLQIYETFEMGDTHIISQPLIILGTSALKSAIQGAIRNSDKKPISFFKNFKDLIIWGFKDEKMIKKLRNTMYNPEEKNVETMDIISKKNGENRHFEKVKIKENTYTRVKDYFGYYVSDKGNLNGNSIDEDLTYKNEFQAIRFYLNSGKDEGDCYLYATKKEEPNTLILLGKININDKGEEVGYKFLEESSNNDTKVEDNESLEESYITSKKDIEYKLDSWKKGSDNILLITGLSGSGKSTRASQLSKEYNAINFELDLFEHNSILFSNNYNHDEANIIMKDIFKKMYGGKKNFDKYSDEDYRKEFVKFFKNLQSYCKSHKDQLFIIEGLQIFKHVAYYDISIIENTPIIIIGTSLTKSLIRRYKRDHNTSDGSFKHPIQLMKKYIEWEKSLNNLRNSDYLKESSNNSELSDLPKINSKYLENKDDIYNIKNWAPDKYNILFITGMSGSGKTTLGEDLAKINKCQRVELDYIVYYFLNRAREKGKQQNTVNKLKKDCPDAAKFFTAERDVKYHLESWGDHSPVTKEFLDWFIQTHEGDGNLYIINGAQIPDVLDYDFFEERPIIIKDPNLVKNVTRRTMRESKFSNYDSFSGWIRGFGRHIKLYTDKGYRDSVKRLKKFSNNINNIRESVNGTELYPVYIVTSYTDTKFGKIIRKASDCYYTHAAISFESDLHEMYSFGNSGTLSNSKLGGMTCESLNDYIKTSKNAVILVSVVFVKEKDYKKLLAFFDEYLNNSRNTRYSYSNLFNVLKNKPISNTPSLSYICSQFVDSLFKFISIDMTDKPSNLVTPEDIANLHNVKPTVYKLFEGKAIDYNINRIEKILDKMYSKAKPIKEVTLLEAKEFPIQFNDEGDLLISKKEKIDFLAEYNKSKKLRQSYVKYKNLEGLKYECCKMWYINTILMKLLDDKNLSHSDRDDYNNYRSKILTEFSQYLKEIQKIDKSFNFGSFYETTPFSNTKIKINGSTIKYTTKLMKFIFK